MQAGKLRHRVAIRQPTMAADSYGQPIPTWATLTTVWASVEPLSGKERMAAQEIHADVTIRVRMRHTTVTPNHRLLVDSSRELDIVAVIDPQERGAQLELMCKESA